MFEKGKSGNPGGRPKVANEVKELAQKHGQAAIKRLAELMHDEDKRVSVSACQALLDRGFGKPVQATEISGPGGSDINIAAIERRVVDPKAV